MGYVRAGHSGQCCPPAPDGILQLFGQGEVPELPRLLDRQVGRLRRALVVEPGDEVTADLGEGDDDQRIQERGLDRPAIEQVLVESSGDDEETGDPAAEDGDGGASESGDLEEAR